MLLRIARMVVLPAFLCLPGLALAGASSVPFDYKPDPAMQRESPAQLQTRVRRSCLATQAKVEGSRDVQRGCGCYAARVIRGLDASELAAYRSTGIFNDSARAKAFAALDGCGLKRP